MKYRGRDWIESEICLIRELIKEHPEKSRSFLSRVVCERLGWRKPDGGLKEMACRVVMLEMERDGLIEQPARKQAPRQIEKRTQKQVPDADPGEPIAGSVTELTALRLEPVIDRAKSALWNDLIHRYHYLGHRLQGGAQIRYLAYAGEQLLGCLAFSGAAWKTKPRDLFIGWDAKKREKRLHLVIDNSRFLILPWVKVPNLATKLLSMAAKRIPADWQARYNYRPYLIETFVDKSRFPGTCYKAANWIYVGDTQGRGRFDRKHEAHGKAVKSIWLYPLSHKFRENLTQ